MDLSLFNFSADGATTRPDKYGLLLETSAFADERGFCAVWIPERHFQQFGGLYPNPSVVAAAVAARTTRVELRAGSLVLPLHHPVRVVEDWAVVDNVSNGRVAISFASGWHPHDFVLAPEVYEDRKGVMIDRIDVVRRLWAGETVPLPGPGGEEVGVYTYPRPIQRELPVWLTSTASPSTFELAGRLGASVLAALIAQPIEELARKIALYRESRRAAGHPGRGRVAVMLHTFLGTNLDDVRAAAAPALAEYLRTFLLQQQTAAAEFEALRPSEKDQMVEFAARRYLSGSSLIGTLDVCRATIERMRSIDVDEIACLIDVGVPDDALLPSLELLDVLRAEVAEPATAVSGSSSAG